MKFYISWELIRLFSGKLQVQDEEYAINEDFQQSALQLADALDLDEVDSAKILFEAQDDAEVLGRSLLESAIIRFHQKRKYLLDSFRLVLQVSIDINMIEAIRDVLQAVIGRVLDSQDNNRNGPGFVRKCLQNMEDMKSMLQNLTDRLNGASVLGQAQRPEFLETIEYQRVSLVQQHESLGVIMHYLIKANFATPHDFEQLLEILKRADKYDNILGMSFHLPLCSLYSFGEVCHSRRVRTNHQCSTFHPGFCGIYLCVWRSRGVFISARSP